MKEIPEYTTPQNYRCPECGKPCKIIGLNNATDVAATHCTHGLSETWYPPGWGDPVTSCCEAPIDSYWKDEDYE